MSLRRNIIFMVPVMLIGLASCSFALESSKAMQDFKKALDEINNNSLGEAFKKSPKDAVALAIARASKGLSPQEAGAFSKELVGELAGSKLDVEQYFGYLGDSQTRKLGQWSVREGEVVSFKRQLNNVSLDSGSNFPFYASVSGNVSKIFVSSGEEFGDEALALIEVSGTWIAVAIAQQISLANESATLDVALALSELSPSLTEEICATLSASLPKLGDSIAQALGRLNPQESGALDKTESEFVYDDPQESNDPSGGTSDDGSPASVPLFPGFEGGGGGGGMMYQSSSN